MSASSRPRAGARKFDPVLARMRADEMNRKGLWPNRTLADHVDAAVAASPDKVAVIDRAAGGDAVRLSYRALDEAASRIAVSLRAMGIGRDDVVSIQLPNCWQFVAVVVACSKVGAVANPLMPIFRERELLFMLRFAESRLLIAPDVWRGRDHAGMVRGLLPQLPALERIVVLGEQGPDGFDEVLLGAQAPAHGAAAARERQHCDDVALLMYTSGTMGEPKGVMHTSNTLMATLSGALDELRMSADDVALCAAPMGHMVGLALLCILPIMAGAATVIVDAWDASAALALSGAERVTYTAGPPTYLADLLDAHAARGAAAPARLRLLCCAGAPIAPVLIERAAREMGLSVCSMWGMTEVQAGTVTGIDAAQTHSAIADGRPPRGMEVKIVDDAGAPVAPGRTGRLLVRGSGVFAGYLKRPEWNAVDADGWFDTGDLAYLVDADGYVRIDGRAKDIIKRGGESIPVVEVESLLARHPAVTGVAIVGCPDERLGERACAFVTLRPGHSLDLGGMQDYLERCRLTRQYWPERLEVAAELPRTPSGKIQKYRLRELARAG